MSKSNGTPEIDIDLFSYHWKRTLKEMQDSLEASKSTKAKVEIAQVIDRLLFTHLEREKVAKMREPWE